MPRAPTFKVRCGDWIRSLEEQNYPTTTTTQYETSVGRAWEFGREMGWPQDPRKIQASHVRDYLEHIQQYSSGYQYNLAEPLLLFLRWCKNKHLEKFKLKITVTRHNVNWLTEQEVAALLASPPNMQTGAIERMYAYTGMRKIELTTLRMEDVQQDHLTVRGKGTKYRNIPLTKQFWESMTPYMEWRRRQSSPFFLLHPSNGCHPIGPYTVDGIATAVRDHSIQAGFRFSSHTFRRSFGRHLYKAGMPLPEIQRLYGHSSVEMTIKYLGITDEDVSASLTRFQPRYR